MQGFGLTIGSDFYLVLDRRARRDYYHNALQSNLTYTHGQFVFSNSTSLKMVSGVIGTAITPSNSSTMAVKVITGMSPILSYDSPLPLDTRLSTG
jgi:hypothetical protein